MASQIFYDQHAVCINPTVILSIIIKTPATLQGLVTTKVISRPGVGGAW